MRDCRRYECDGRHYLVAIYRDRHTAVLQMQRPILDADDETHHLEDTEPPNGWLASVEAVRCEVCNPEPVADEEDAAQIEHEPAAADDARYWYQDK